LTSSVPMNPSAPVINVVATASPAMQPVWNTGRPATTHSAPTGLAQRPYAGSRMEEP
jgi:hypothetical protein